MNGHALNPPRKLHVLFVGLFRWLSYYAIHHPRQVLALAIVVNLATVPGILRLKLRTDGHALVSPTAPEVVADKAVRDHFGLHDQMVVLIRPADTNGVFNPATLQLVRDLTAEFKQLPGVTPADVMSLATEPSFRMRPGTLIQQKLLEPPLQTRPELDQLREDLRRIELYSGTLVSGDSQSTVILVGVPATADRTQFYAEILQIITAKQTAANTIAVTGAPVAETLFGVEILEDLGVPKALLGAGAQQAGEKSNWKMPANLHELRGFVARHIGLVLAGGAGDDAGASAGFPQRPGGVAAAAGRDSDPAAGLWLDGLAGRADLPYHRRNAGAAHRDFSHQRHLSVQPLFQFVTGKNQARII